MGEAQTTYLTGSSASPDKYRKVLEQYEKRLEDLKHLRVKLRNKRVSILKTAQELNNLEAERYELIELMKKTQDDYFKKKKLNVRRFSTLYGLQKQRLAELDEEKVLLEEKHEAEKDTNKYKFMKWLTGVLINKKKKFMYLRRRR